MTSVTLKKVIDYFNLKELTHGIDSEKIKILVPDINRPALQLAGFYEHFDVNDGFRTVFLCHTLHEFSLQGIHVHIIRGDEVERSRIPSQFGLLEGESLVLLTEGCLGAHLI